jgi:tetratricopeptide (TPR) repeat protein
VGACYSDLAIFLAASGRSDEANTLWSRQTPEFLNGAAWRLVTDTNLDSRNPELAVMLAQRAVERAPDQGYIVNTLGTAYYRVGEWTKAIETLKQADELYQGQSFSSDAFFIAMSHWQLGELETACRWYDAAARWMDRFSADNDEQRRFRAEAAALLGVANEPGQDPPLDDRALYSLILEAWPESAWTCLRRAQAWDHDSESQEAQNDYRRGLENYDRLMELKPRSAQILAQRGFARSQVNDWDGAVRDLEAATSLGAVPSIWYLPVLSRLGAHDLPGYRQACAHILEGLSKSTDVGANRLAAWACAIGPEAAADLSQAISLIERATQESASSLELLNTLGALYYRAGRFDEALQALERANQTAQEPRALSTPIYAWLFLAMSQQRLGHPEQARSWLAKARDAIESARQEHRAGKAKLPWNRRVTLSVLLDEAETLVNPPAP